MNNARPPAIVTWVIEQALPREAADAAIGDLDEEFAALSRRISPSAARRWYWRQACSLSAASAEPLDARPRVRPGPRLENGPHATRGSLRAARASTKRLVHNRRAADARAWHRRHERHLQLRRRRAPSSAAAMVLTALGVALGVGAAFATGRVLPSLLFGVTPGDAVSIIAAAWVAAAVE